MHIGIYTHEQCHCSCTLCHMHTCYASHSYTRPISIECMSTDSMRLPIAVYVAVVITYIHACTHWLPLYNYVCTIHCNTCTRTHTDFEIQFNQDTPAVIANNMAFISFSSTAQIDSATCELTTQPSVDCKQ